MSYLLLMACRDLIWFIILLSMDRVSKVAEVSEGEIKHSIRPFYD